MSQQTRRLFRRITNIYNKQISVAQNPEMAASYTKFGKKSVTYSILTLIFAAAMPYLSAYLFNLGITANLALVGNIFCVAFAVAIVILPFYFMPFATAYCKAQRKTNDLKIGKTALILAIISIVLGVVMTIGLTIWFYSILLV